MAESSALRVRSGLQFVQVLRPALYALLVLSALFTFWDIPKDFADPVTLRMTEAASGEPVRVWSERRPAPETSATFVRSGYNNDGYDRHSADFFIPRAGCYVLEASWPGGSWTVRLAAGQ